MNESWSRLHLVSLLIVISGSACFLMNLRPQIDVTDYHGEGAISQIRSAENPGFKVDFESFSLAKPHASRYRMDGIPRAHGATPCDAGLAVDLTDEEESQWPPMPENLVRGAQGTLTIRLEDAAGATLFEGTGEIGAFQWNKFIGDSPFGRIPAWRYRPGSKGELPEQSLFLVVTYAPGSDSPDRQANVRFTAGGRH